MNPQDIEDDDSAIFKEPTKLEMLLSDLNQSGTSEYDGLLFPVSARLEPFNFGFLEALTSQAGTSRNKMINSLLEIAVEQVVTNLDPEIAIEIRRHCSAIVRAAIDNKSGERGKL